MHGEVTMYDGNDVVCVDVRRKQVPMPKETTTATTKGSTEETFSPYSEDQEQEASSAVAVVEENQIEVPRVPVSYDYVPTSEDISTPRIQLLQGNADFVLQGNAKAGDWMLPGGELLTTFTVDILGMRRSRIRATKPPPNSSEKPKMLCTSPDAVQGYGDPGILCAQCPFAQWGDKDPKTGKGTPPQCRLRYHYLCETPNGERAELMIGTTTKDSKLAAQAITEGIARWGNGGAFRVTMTRKLTEGGGGNKFFVPVVKAVEKNDDTEEEVAPGFE